MKRLLLLLLVSVGWLLGSTAAQAAFVNTLVGNSGFEASTQGGGWVNFAVYDNPIGENWVDELGLTGTLLVGPSISPAATGFERSVFFYQIVRNDVNTNELLRDLEVPFGTADGSWSTVGVLDGIVFNNADGAVGPSPNETLGSENAAPGEVKRDGSLAGTPFVPHASAINATGAEIAPGGTSAGNAFFQWSIGSNFSGNKFSSVVFITSERPVPPYATFARADTNFGVGQGGPGVMIPVATPEPGSLVLLGLAAGFGAIGYGWKRRKVKSAQQSEA